MIKNNDNNQTIVEFGKGNVGIIPAVYDGKGILSFDNSGKGTIGEHLGVITREEVEQCPLIMKFENTESAKIVMYNIQKMIANMESKVVDE